MNASHSEARRALQSAFAHRRHRLQELAHQLHAAVLAADNPSIRSAFHNLSAAIEGRIVWEQGTVLPTLTADRDTSEAGCAGHVESDHLLLLRLLDAFGEWIVAQPLTLDEVAREVGLRHFERLWNMLCFHEDRQASFTYPALTHALSSTEVRRLAEAMSEGAPFQRSFASAA
ncbi:MAG TPA: hypothetical protein PKZ76_02615 [Xanthomonadaceae bacterium]|nr:hypothetical protein [Xanthomonadaceae bacterium]